MQPQVAQVEKYKISKLNNS